MVLRRLSKRIDTCELAGGSSISASCVLSSTKMPLCNSDDTLISLRHFQSYWLYLLSKYFKASQIDISANRVVNIYPQKIQWCMVTVLENITFEFFLILHIIEQCASNINVPTNKETIFFFFYNNMPKNFIRHKDHETVNPSNYKSQPFIRLTMLALLRKYNSISSPVGL